MNHLDLFSGIGGFALAAKWCGIETIQFVENNLFCQKVLAKNFPNTPIHNDIKTFDSNYLHNKVYLLTGGFPCQGFSIAGRKKGKNDNRYLWPEMYRIIRQCNPDWIIAENVTGIIEMELHNIISDLEREGYETQSFVLPACAANSPHRRDRIWIVANAMCKRCDNGIYYWKSRYVSKNKKWNMEEIQSKWEKLKPEPWKAFSARNWFQYNTIISGSDDGFSKRLDKDRIKSLGNAIVPQVVYPIILFIKETGKNK